MDKESHVLPLPLQFVRVSLSSAFALFPQGSIAVARRHGGRFDSSPCLVQGIQHVLLAPISLEAGEAQRHELVNQRLQALITVGHGLTSLTFDGPRPAGPRA